MSNTQTARVYVVQKTMRWDAPRGELVPKFDLSPAQEYGTLEYLLSPTASPFRPEALLPELHEKLSQFTEEDYLLLVGNPVLIGLAVCLAADYAGGSVNLLQWSGKAGKYLPVVVRGIFDACPQGVDLE